MPSSVNPRETRESHESSTPRSPQVEPVKKIDNKRYSEYTGLKPSERNILNTQQIDIEQIDPLGILNQTPSMTLVKLAQTYVTLRNIHHPDKGGEHEKFILIMDALKTIKWVDSAVKSDKTYMDLKKNFTESVQTEYNQSHATQTTASRSNEIPDKFKNMSNDKFNRLFEENRYTEDDDGGYGEFMEPSNGKREDIEVKRTLSRFKKEEFNREFARSKHLQKGDSKELIRYQVPESMHTSNLGYIVLGDNKEKKYTGYAGRLQYTDYMDAYTSDNTLVDDTELPDHIKRRIRQKNLQKSLAEYKRSDMKLTPEQQAAVEEYDKKTEQMEYQRQSRFQEQVRKYEEYDKTIRNRIGY
jgi:hypothetical protein